MKKLLFLMSAVFLTLNIIGQSADVDTIAYEAGVTTHKDVRDKLNETIVRQAEKADTVDQTFTGVITLPEGTSIGDVDSSEISYLDGLTSDAQDQLDALSADIDTLETDTVDIDDVALALTDYAIMLNDTIQLFVFGGGGGNAGDTAVFTTSTIYGSFFNESRDTLVVTSLRCVMLGEAGDTLGVDINWDANLGDGTPEFQLNADPLPCNSLTTGNEDTSFAEDKIPPDYWVWCATPTVVAAKKPKYFNAQISGYIKRTE